MKRERQLKSQIENLISDSLGLLKCRLNELGIQAKSPPEFIEKAKSIVCNHHELQRGKASLENEIRQLEAEQEKVIAAKEKELLEKIMKSGVSYGDAKAIIQKQIDGALNGFKGGNGHNADPKVAPFLNKVNLLNINKVNFLTIINNIFFVEKEYLIHLFFLGIAVRCNSNKM